MARTRTIKPSFCTNEDIAACSPLARLLFIYLWMQSDRRGRIEDRPKRLKAECLPFDDVDLDGLLTELAQHGFLVRYEADGRKCIQIINFEKHQRPHPHEAESELPAIPCQHNDMPLHDTSRCALTLTPHTIIPCTHTHTLLEPAGNDPARQRVCFDKFWESFPKKTKREPAWVEWAKLSPDAATFEKIMAAIEANKLSHRWRAESGRYVPNPAKWLADRGWEDEPEPAETTGPPARASPKKRDVLAEKLGLTETATEAAT